MQPNFFSRSRCNGAEYAGLNARAPDLGNLRFDPFYARGAPRSPEDSTRFPGAHVRSSKGDEKLRKKPPDVLRETFLQNASGISRNGYYFSSTVIG